MPEFDEYGIPIRAKKATAAVATVDEFGIPIKKKVSTGISTESPTSTPLNSFPSNGLFGGTSNTSLSKSPSALPLNAASKLYNENDEAELKNLTSKYAPTTIESLSGVVGNIGQQLGIPQLSSESVSENPYALKLRETKALEKSIRQKMFQKEVATNVAGGSAFGGAGAFSNTNKDEYKELNRVESIKKKLSAELAIDGMNEVEAKISTDQTGNTFNYLATRGKIVLGALGLGDNSGIIEMNEEVDNKISTLPPEFFTGLNYLKNAEPATFERLSNSVLKNMPISESQVAQVTAEGLAIEEERLVRKAVMDNMPEKEYNTQLQALQKKKVDNLLNNRETLRAALSNGVAEGLDAVERSKQVDEPGGVAVGNSVLGFRWGYDDTEIKSTAERWALDHGLDPKTPQVQDAIKYLQDNEGAMIGQNSIAKNSIAREIGQGVAEPFRGIASSVGDIFKDENQIYVDSQSQGNANVSRQRLIAEDTGWRGVVNDVAKGAGQFASQAGIALAGSGLIGLAGEGLAIANTVNRTKDFASTLMTSFAQTYDSNLKTALNYTSDNNAAKGAAFINSTIEGLSENILSPIDIARGARNAFKSQSGTEGLLKVLTEENVLKNPSLLRDYITTTLRGGLETVKVAGTEIGEEFVTQIADFATNAYLNPDSDSFKNRELASELAQTAYQTGLSMAIPALANGLGAANANSFAKGSLLIAAQNRQQLIDDLEVKKANNGISEDDYNRTVAIVNTAAKANETLPLKADNTKLNSDEKADYIFSRVSEGVMKRRMEDSNDEAEKTVLAEKIKQQQDFRTGILKTSNATETPSISNTEIPTSTTPANLDTANATGEGTGILNADGVSQQQAVPDVAATGAIGEQPVQENQNTETENDSITVSEMIDKVGSYKGQRGSFVQDGQTVVFKVEGQNKEYELGNIDELQNTPINDFDITHEDSVVSFDDAGNIAVRGVPYVNNFSNPLSAINRDETGNILSVNLETADGKKRTFRGNVAEDIAYQINLKEITKDNETATRFEDFLNGDEATQAEINAATVQETTEGNAVVNNETVQREKLERITPLEKAKAIIPSLQGNPVGVAPLKQAVAEKNDADLNEYLKAIAEQAQDPRSTEPTVRMYGQPLVDIANQLFPPSNTNQNAIQEQESNEGVLRNEGFRGQGELQTVEQGNQVEESPQESQAQEIATLEQERDAEIKKVSKPDIKLNLVSTTDLVNSKDPVGNKSKHDKIKSKFKQLKSLIECLGT